MVLHSTQWLELEVAGVGELQAERIKARTLIAGFVIGITVSSTGAIAYVLAGIKYDAFPRTRVGRRSVVGVDAAPEVFDRRAHFFQQGFGFVLEGMPRPHVERPGRPSDEILVRTADLTASELRDDGRDHRLEMIEHRRFPAVRSADGHLEAIGGVSDARGVPCFDDSTTPDEGFERCSARVRSEPGRGPDARFGRRSVAV